MISLGAKGVDAMKKLGLGIVGTGVIAGEHAKACTQLAERVRLLAVADLSTNAVQRFTANWFAPYVNKDYRELCDRPDVDIVAVCTPPFTHEEIVKYAMRAGKYVLCEKPLACSVEAVDRIAAVESDFPGKLSTVFQVRYLPDVCRMQLALKEGLIGENASGSCFRLSNIRGKAGPWWGQWSVAGGGAVMTQFIHQLDLICVIFGEPRSVNASMSTEKVEIESEDSCEATVEFTSGCKVKLDCTAVADEVKWGMTVQGTAASASIPWSVFSKDVQVAKSIEGRVTEAVPIPKKPSRALFARIARRIQRTLLKTKHQVILSGHALYLQDVVSAIDNHNPLPVSLAESRRAIELCMAIYEASITNTTVHFPLSPENLCYAGVDTSMYMGKSRVIPA